MSSQPFPLFFLFWFVLCVYYGQICTLPASQREMSCFEDLLIFVHSILSTDRSILLACFFPHQPKKLSSHLNKIIMHKTTQLVHLWHGMASSYHPPPLSPQFSFSLLFSFSAYVFFKKETHFFSEKTKLFLSIFPTLHTTQNENVCMKQKERERGNVNGWILQSRLCACFGL